MSDISKIGFSIRSLRKSRKVTLQQLAEETGLSTGYLSNVERNVSSPTLDNIQKICEVFGKSLGDLLERNAEQKVIIRKEDREVTVDEKNNMHVETIDFGAGNATFLYMTLDPGNAAEELWWTHECDEVGTVLEGEVVTKMAGEIFELKEGDTIWIPAGTKHCCYNKSDTVTAVSYWARYWDKAEEEV